jgi:hypothetical protein
MPKYRALHLFVVYISVSQPFELDLCVCRTPYPSPPFSLIYLYGPIPVVDAVTSEKLLYFHVIYILEYVYILSSALDYF